MAENDSQLSVFPAFFKVENAVAAVFGDGAEAYAKVRLLKNTKARIVAYTAAPEADYAAFLAQHDIA
ncbi:uroporphyrin-III C-methyltransferase, partial [Rhizobium sp. PDO1-076]